MIESIFLAVGINLIPILIWILIIPIIIFKFKSLDRKIKKLLCYFILTCSLMTIISPFEFYTGALSVFTVSGEVPLGGKIGQNISDLWSWHFTAIQILITGIALGLIVPNKSLNYFKIYFFIPEKNKSFLNIRSNKMQAKTQMTDQNSIQKSLLDTNSDFPDPISKNIEKPKQNQIDLSQKSQTTKQENNDLKSDQTNSLNWQLPKLDILEDFDEPGISKEDIDKTAQTIKKTLSDYNVDVEIGKVQPGPTVTMYGLIPGGIKKYKSAKNDNEFNISNIKLI